MSYDHWKTTNPDEQTEALPMDDQPTELDLAYDRIRQLENALEEIAAEDFHPLKSLPGCMMPDGGECCAGHTAVVEDWHKQRREIERLRKALEEINAEVLPEIRASELELIVWWGRQVDRLQAIARNALTVGKSE